MKFKLFSSYFNRSDNFFFFFFTESLGMLECLKRKNNTVLQFKAFQTKQGTKLYTSLLCSVAEIRNGKEKGENKSLTSQNIL